MLENPRGFTPGLLSALHAFDQDVLSVHEQHDFSAVQEALDRLDEVQAIPVSRRLRTLLNFLSQITMASDPSSEWYPHAIQRIRRWCRDSGLLPSAFSLSIPVEESSLHCHSQTAVSDVYKGSCSGNTVAVKSLRLHEDSRNEIKKVRPCAHGHFRSILQTRYPVSKLSL
jgi:hypothetical protein